MCGNRRDAAFVTAAVHCTVGGEVKRFEELVFERTEAVVGAPDVQKRLLFERIEIRGAAGVASSLRLHEAIIVVPTIVVQTTVVEADGPYFSGNSRR